MPANLGYTLTWEWNVSYRCLARYVECLTPPRSIHPCGTQTTQHHCNQRLSYKRGIDHQYSWISEHANPIPDQVHRNDTSVGPTHRSDKPSGKLAVQLALIFDQAILKAWLTKPFGPGFIGIPTKLLSFAQGIIHLVSCMFPFSEHVTQTSLWEQKKELCARRDLTGLIL